ncbi:MAG TPA: ABC transporter permease [Planctomycetota bacterium]
MTPATARGGSALALPSWTAVLGAFHLRPRRALATVLGVAVGVAAVLATALASRAAVASMTDDVEALAGAARLEVTQPGGVPLEHLARLAPLAGELVIAPVVEGTALVAGSGELVRILGVDTLGTGEARFAGEIDARLGERFLRREGVLLARPAAAKLGLAVGRRLALIVQSRRVELELLALFDPPRAASAWERVLVADVALAQELLGRGEHVDRLTLAPRAGVPFDEAATIARVQALLPEGARVAPASERRADGERFVRSLTFNLTALAGVSVLVAIVLVATTLATAVVERRAVIALLRSLGASQGQLGAAVLAESAAIGLAGGLLGVVLGWAGARAIAADVHGSFATLSEDVLLGAVRLEPAWIVAGLALGLGTALVAAFLPLLETWRTPPVQHLRLAGVIEGRSHPRARAGVAVALLAGAALAARQPAVNGRPLWALVSTLLLLAVGIVLARPLLDLLARVPLAFLGERFGTPLRLAQAALAAARRRAAWAASAVGVAVALAIAMTTMIASFRSSVVAWTDQTMRSDLYLRPVASADGTSAGRIGSEAVAAVTALFGPERVDPYHETFASVGGERIVLGGAPFAVAEREGGVPFLDGRPFGVVFAEARARGGVVVNEPFERRFGLGRGDRVRLTTPGGTLEREIVGVYRDFSGHLGRVVLELEDFLRVAGDEGAESVGVHLPPEADVEAERARLRAALAGRFELEVLDAREVRAEVLRVFERTFAVTSALQGISALVAALAVVLVLTALVRERERELAVVRVLGGSRAQLGLLVAGQAFLLGLAGAGIGLGVGLAAGTVLVAVVNVQSFGWSLDLTVPASVLWSAAAVVPACLVAGWIPAWLSLRLQPQEALREPD